ncbi:hypothetical protein FVEG_15139 [Fusarium verticillioides 7600]|uniref:Uncharacterized protein n=1 Tax=Gibberella moniliformis (strain M3125 / FGSC 7600) TaxID=334819 RepID=W7LYK2_GIBM7|nr:hypothetical protein FVEG_15139 [Fusarium verticillioides 7600]EWG40474.1 hypothetical protein FVEG_15139 [Fusarium verticillioides 7600]
MVLRCSGYTPMIYLCPCSRTPRTTHQSCWERSLAFNNALQRVLPPPSLCAGCELDGPLVLLCVDRRVPSAHTASGGTACIFLWPLLDNEMRRTEYFRNNTMHLGHVWLCAHGKTRYHQKPSMLRTAGTQALSLSLNPSITQYASYRAWSGQR